jgi:hypothetical protein
MPGTANSRGTRHEFACKKRAKHAKNGAKTRSRPLLNALMRNSLFARALIREILYSPLCFKREIVCSFPQRIAKFQANIAGVIGRR